MKTNICIIACIFYSINSIGQENPREKQSIGIEFLGNAGLYSMVYHNCIYQKNNFEVSLRPQISILPGSTSDSIPRNLVTIIGLGSSFYFNDNFSLGINYSVGPELIWGFCDHSLNWISSISIGPKIKTELANIRLTYVYFIQEPDYFYFPTFPNSIGIPIEVPI